MWWWWWWWLSTIHSPPALFFFKWRLAQTYLFHSLGQDQSTVAQRAEMTVTKCSLMSCVWAHFPIGSHTMPGQQYSRLTPTSSGVTCYLHFWQNDWGLSRATAVTRGWNRYRIRVSTKKVDSGEENSPAAPAGIRTFILWITSPVR